MQDDTALKVAAVLKGVGINGADVPLLIVDNKAINEELHKTIGDYLYTQRLLRLGTTQIEVIKNGKSAESMSLKETEKENASLLNLMIRLMRLNAFLAMSFRKEEKHDLAAAEFTDFADKTLADIIEIHYQKSLDVIQAINNVSSNIEVILRRPESRAKLGFFTLKMEELVREFEAIKKYRHLVCQAINIQREPDYFKAKEIIGEAEPLKLEEPTKAVMADRKLSDEFQKIFFYEAPKGAEINCSTITHLERLFAEQSSPLKALLDLGFKFSLSDNKRPEMFISDKAEWERYKKDSSLRFSYNNRFKYFSLLPDLNENQLLSMLTDGLKYFEWFQSLLEKTKETYFQLKLNEIWSDYNAIEVSRTSWTDISLHDLSKRLEVVAETAKENLNGARHLFKEHIIEGILRAPSERMMPPREYCPQIYLYE